MANIHTSYINSAFSKRQCTSSYEYVAPVCVKGHAEVTRPSGHQIDYFPARGDESGSFPGRYLPFWGWWVVVGVVITTESPDAWGTELYERAKNRTGTAQLGNINILRFVARDGGREC